MNLPRGTLKSIEEWEHAQPINCLSQVDPHFSGVIRFFERGQAWNVFFLLFEEGSLIGYYTTRGNTPLEEKLHSTVEGFEMEMRAFTPAEIEIARNLNKDYLLETPMQVSEFQKELDVDSRIRDFFPDASFLAEIKRARQFKEDFHRRRTEKT